MSHTYVEETCKDHKCVGCKHKHESSHWMNCTYCAYACVTDNGQCHWEEIEESFIFTPMDMTQTLETVG